MGRAKILWRHQRDVRCEMSNTFVKYIIPVHTEKPDIGKFMKAELNPDRSFLTIYFEKNNCPPVAGGIQVIQEEEHLFRVDFLK